MKCLVLSHSDNIFVAETEEQIDINLFFWFIGANIDWRWFQIRFEETEYGENKDNVKQYLISLASKDLYSTTSDLILEVYFGGEYFYDDKVKEARIKTLEEARAELLTIS